MKRPLVFSIVLMCCVVACSSEHTSTTTEETQDERSVTQFPEANGRNLPALGEPLLIALAQARNHHHKADILLEQGRLDDAIASVRAISDIPFPEGAPEAEDIALDARARLAKLLLTRGDIEEAMTVVEQAIAGATRESFFLANLYTVQGDVYQARARLLDDEASDEAKEQAKAARRSAIEALDRSIAINTRLQTALMNEVAP